MLHSPLPGAPLERLPRRIKITWQATDAILQAQEERLAELVAGFLEGLGFARSGVTLLLGDDDALQELNGRFRGQAAPTDILSWSYLADGSQPELLGELAVSLQRVHAQAQENGWDAWTELARLLAHGCAHLAGHIHDTTQQDRAMREVEERLLASAGIRHLYDAPPALPGVRVPAAHGAASASASAAARRRTAPRGPARPAAAHAPPRRRAAPRRSVLPRA